MKGVPDFYGVWKFHLRRKNLSPKAAAVVRGREGGGLNGGKSIVFQEYKQVVWVFMLQCLGIYFKRQNAGTGM